MHCLLDYKLSVSCNKKTTLLMLKKRSQVFELIVLLDYSFTLLPSFILLTKQNKTNEKKKKNEQNKDVLN